jgi:phosphoheptose isomerase
MENQKFINDIKCKFHERQSSIARIINNSKLLQNLLLLYNKFLECFDNGNKLIFCGNGGSAADCQHIVAEFIVKLSKLRKSLPAISLTSNNSIITAISNDINFSTIFTKQLEGIANPRDILIGIHQR